ncbi:hypothetical protein ACJX0J_033520, partial [Zea mays]
FEFEQKGQFMGRAQEKEGDKRREGYYYTVEEDHQYYKKMGIWMNILATIKLRIKIPHTLAFGHKLKRITRHAHHNLKRKIDSEENKLEGGAIVDFERVA